jgi:hypothetical protein
MPESTKKVVPANLFLNNARSIRRDRTADGIMRKTTSRAKGRVRAQVKALPNQLLLPLLSDTITSPRSTRLSRRAH